MDHIIWIKPSGMECITNSEEHNIKKANELGWVRKEQDEKPKKRKYTKKSEHRNKD